MATLPMVKQNGKWVRVLKPTLNTRNTTRMPMVSYDAAAGISPEYARKRTSLLRNVGMQGSGLATGGAGGTLEAEYKKAYETAKAANEQRYKDILGGYEQQGRQAVKDVNSAFDAAEARGVQDLVNSGLAGTTVLPSMRAGNARQRSAAVGRLKEALLADKLGFMERRTDEYPDYSQMLTLAQMQGQGQGLSKYSGGAYSRTLAPLRGFAGFSSNRSSVSSYMPGAGAFQEQAYRPQGMPAKPLAPTLVPAVNRNMYLDDYYA